MVDRNEILSGAVLPTGNDNSTKSIGESTGNSMASLMAMMGISTEGMGNETVKVTDLGVGMTDFGLQQGLQSATNGAQSQGQMGSSENAFVTSSMFDNNDENSYEARRARREAKKEENLKQQTQEQQLNFGVSEDDDIDDDDPVDEDVSVTKLDVSDMLKMFENAPTQQEEEKKSDTVNEVVEEIKNESEEKEIIEKEGEDMSSNVSDIMDFSQDAIDEEYYDEVGDNPAIDDTQEVEDYSEYMVDDTNDVVSSNSIQEEEEEFEDEVVEDEIIEEEEETTTIEEPKQELTDEDEVVEDETIEEEEETITVEEPKQELTDEEADEVIDSSEEDDDLIDDDDDGEIFNDEEEYDDSDDIFDIETSDSDNEIVEYDDEEVPESCEDCQLELPEHDVLENIQQVIDEELDKDEELDDEDDEIDYEEMSIESEQDIINDVLDSAISDETQVSEEELDEAHKNKSKECVNEIADAFWDNVELVEKQYGGSLSKYISDNSDNINKNILSEIYTNEQFKYQNHIDFDIDSNREKLWAISIAKYIQSRNTLETEYEESDTTMVGSELRDCVDVRQLDIEVEGEKTTEDETIAAYKDKMKRDTYKYGKTNIDRAIIEITEEESDDTNIFYDTKPIEREFFESKFYKIFKEVMISDKLVNMDNIKMKVVINKNTAFIPVVDFDTGVRIICIDTSDTTQYRLNPYMISNNVNFSFKQCRNVKTRMLYLDNVIARPMATVFALKKTIAFPKYINPKHLVELRPNYIMAYTTERDQILNFENGDPDVRGSYENSTYKTNKPSNKNLGFIILTKKSGSDKQEIRRKQTNQNRQNNIDFLKQNLDDYEFHFVLSAEYICDASKLANQTLPESEKYVQYVITQYNESNSVVLMDGLQCVCSGIVKEHEKQFGLNTKYSIEYEFDRASLVSPGVTHIIDNGGSVDGFMMERSYTTVVNPRDTQVSYILPPSRLKSEGVLEEERGRNDRRFMNRATIVDRYLKHDPGLLSRYNLDTEDGKNEFIRSRGFELFVEPRSVVFDVMPHSMAMVSTSKYHKKLRNISVNSIGDRNTMDVEQMLNDQMLLDYERGYTEGDFSGWGRTAFNIIDTILDINIENNKMKNK